MSRPGNGLGERIERGLRLAVALPFVRAELPGWGKVYGRLVGTYRSNEAWRGATPRIYRNKQHGYFLVANLAEWSDRLCYFLGRWYDEELAWLIPRLVGPGDSVVDIGANYGHFCMTAAALAGRHGKVIAFEPNPRAFARLAFHVSPKRCDLRRTAANGPVGRGGEAELNVPNVNSGEATLGETRYADDDVVRVPIKLARGDDALAGENPKLIKIDVEGFELRVLKGLGETIARSRPLIVTELVDRHLANAGASKSLIIELMSARDYAPWRVSSERRGFQVSRWVEPYDLADGDADVLWAPREKAEALLSPLAAR